MIEIERPRGVQADTGVTTHGEDAIEEHSLVGRKARTNRSDESQTREAAGATS